MQEGSDDFDSALADFQLECAADAQAGALLPLSEYQRRYPAHRELIKAEYRRIEIALEDDREKFSAPGVGDVFGPYRIVRRIGAGGQGIVFEAHDSRLARPVALKFLHVTSLFSASRRDRFRREAEVISRLDHPGLCTVYEANLEGDCPYIVMPLLDGTSLAESLTAINLADDSPDRRTAEKSIPGWLVDDGPDAIAKRLRAFEDIARALDTAHAAGVTHRDIKPGNLICRPDGSLLLLDFGMAHDSQHASSALTKTGDRLGTPAYMAPEQFGPDHLPVDHRADIYSLGATLYEALTHRRLHTRIGTLETREKEVTSAISGLTSELKSLPPDVTVVLGAALEIEPSRRYGSALDFAEDLGRIRRGLPIEARRSSVTYRTLRLIQRHKVVCGAIAMTLAACAVGTVMALHGLVRARDAAAAVETSLAKAKRATADAEQTNKYLMASMAVESLRKGDAESARAMLESAGLDEGSWESGFILDWCAQLTRNIETGPHHLASTDPLCSVLVVADEDSELRVFDVPEGKLRNSVTIAGLGERGRWPHKITLSPDATMACLHNHDRTWIVPNLEAERLQPQEVELAVLGQVRFHEVARVVALVDIKAFRVDIVAVDSGKTVRSWQAKSRVTDIDFLSRRELRVQLKDGTSYIWNWEEDSAEKQSPASGPQNERDEVTEPWFINHVRSSAKFFQDGHLRTYSLMIGFDPLGGPGGDSYPLPPEGWRQGNPYRGSVLGDPQILSVVKGRPLVLQAVDPNGRLLTSDGETVTVTDLARFVEPQAAISGIGMATDPDGSTIVRAHAERLIIAPLEAYGPIVRKEVERLGLSNYPALSKDARHVAVIGRRTYFNGAWWLDVLEVDGKHHWARPVPGADSAPRFSPDGEQIAMKTGGRVAVHAVRTGEKVCELGDEAWPVVTFCWMDSSTILTTGFNDTARNTKVSRHHIGETRPEWSELVDGPTTSVAANIEGSLVAIGGEQRITFLQAETGTETGTASVTGVATGLAFLPDDTKRLAAAAGGHLIFVDTKEHSPTLQLQSSFGSIFDVKVSAHQGSIWYHAGSSLCVLEAPFQRERSIKRWQVYAASFLGHRLAGQGNLLDEVEDVFARINWPASMERVIKEQWDGLDGSQWLNKRAWNLATAVRDERFQDALRVVERALELRPGDPSYLNTKAVVLFRLGEFDACLNAVNERMATIHWDVAEGRAYKPTAEARDWYIKSAVHSERGRHAIARQCFGEAERTLATGNIQLEDAKVIRHPSVAADWRAIAKSLLERHTEPDSPPPR